MVMPPSGCVTLSQPWWFQKIILKSCLARAWLYGLSEEKGRGCVATTHWLDTWPCEDAIWPVVLGTFAQAFLFLMACYLVGLNRRISLAVVHIGRDIWCSSGLYIMALRHCTSSFLNHSVPKKAPAHVWASYCTYLKRIKKLSRGLSFLSKSVVMIRICDCSACS